MEQVKLLLNKYSSQLALQMLVSWIMRFGYYSRNSLLSRFNRKPLILICETLTDLNDATIWINDPNGSPAWDKGIKIKGS